MDPLSVGNSANDNEAVLEAAARILESRGQTDIARLYRLSVNHSTGPACFPTNLNGTPSVQVDRQYTTDFTNPTGHSGPRALPQILPTNHANPVAATTVRLPKSAPLVLPLSCLPALSSGHPLGTHTGAVQALQSYHATNSSTDWDLSHIQPDFDPLSGFDTSPHNTGFSDDGLNIVSETWPVSSAHLEILLQTPSMQEGLTVNPDLANDLQLSDSVTPSYEMANGARDTTPPNMLATGLDVASRSNLSMGTLATILAGFAFNSSTQLNRVKLHRRQIKRGIGNNGGPKRRRPFPSNEIKEETRATRNLRACMRCHLYRIRVRSLSICHYLPCSTDQRVSAFRTKTTGTERA